MCILSLLFADKYYFFDEFASFFLNYVMFGKVDKENKFSWAYFGGGMFIHWNKPNYVHTIFINITIKK